MKPNEQKLHYKVVWTYIKLAYGGRMNVKTLHKEEDAEVDYQEILNP